jgi:hypothetical protein
VLRARLTEPARPRKTSEMKANGVTAKRVSVVNSLIAARPVIGGESHVTALRVLLIATCKWPLAARLAITFTEAGCRVEVVGPRGHPALATYAVVRTRLYRPLAPLTSIRLAIQDREHDLVVPCDDLALSHLHDLYKSETGAGCSSSPMATLLARSLGEPTAVASVIARSRLMDIARAEGIRVPETAAVDTFERLEEWLTDNGLPVVLKADGTGGGRGVRIARTRREAELAFKMLSSPPSFIRVVKRVLVDGDWTLVLPFVSRERLQVNAQRLIPGREATVSLSCWQGNVLASIGFEVLRRLRPNGPASVVRMLDNRQIFEAAVRLVRRLNLSGFYGLDFKLDERGEPYLIEMNPRATQSSHLSIGKNGDLVGELVAALSGRGLRGGRTAPSQSVIVLFPNEWQNNPQSEFLGTAYHDVPWSEPDLVRALMKKPSRAARYCGSAS